MKYQCLLQLLRQQKKQAGELLDLLKKGNALFGQWTWSGEGLKPKDAKEGEDH
jgi:hypothetical protein